MQPFIQSVLNSIVAGAVTLTSALGAGRAFELFVISNLTEELRSRGYDVWIRLSDGTDLRRTSPNLKFIQRSGAPGPLPPSSSGPNGPSVICFRRPGSSSQRHWEIWNGIQFRGRSRGLHEYDVAIVPGEIADAIRASGSGGAPLGRGWVAIECKDVASPGSLDEIRAFIARLYDTTLLNGHAWYLGATPPTKRIYALDALSLGMANTSKTYFRENRRTYAAIARTGSFSSGVSQLAEYYNIACFDNLRIPSQMAIFRSEIVDWIDSNMN